MEETFFRLIVRKPLFFNRYSFKTWLYTIGRNIAVDYLRKQSKSADKPMEDCELLLIDEENLEKNYIRSERKRVLHKALSKLRPEYREVLHLTYFEGMTNTQAGKVMKKNKSQIEMLIYRAKKALKKELEKEGFEYEEL